MFRRVFAGDPNNDAITPPARGLALFQNPELSPDFAHFAQYRSDAATAQARNRTIGQ